MRTLPDDRALPALMELFPEKGAPEFAAEMARVATGFSVDAETGKTRYVWYRPGKGCVVLWSFPIPSRGRVLVSGRLFHDAKGAQTAERPSFRRLMERARADGGIAATSMYLPDHRILLQVFPMDLKLPGLSQAISRSWLTDGFPRAARLEAGAQVVEVAPISYKPWRRCVLRYTVEMDGRRTTYFAKAFRDDRGEEMVGRLRTIAERLREVNAPWTTVAPLSYVPEPRLLLLGGIEDGVELKDTVGPALQNPEAEAKLRERIALIAHGLVPFQSIAAEGLHVMTPQALLKRHKRQMEGLDGIAPDLVASVTRQLRRLRVAADLLPPEPRVLSHGAFRHDQFLVSGDKLVALDLDTLCITGANSDAGNFLAYLDRTSLRRTRLRPAVQVCEEAFLEALEITPGFSPKWLAWHRAAAHVKKALRNVFALSPKWPAVAEDLIALSQRTLREGLGQEVVV